MKNLITILCSLFVFSNIHAQQTESKIKKGTSFNAKPWSFGIGISETKNVPLYSVIGADNSIAKVYHPKYYASAEKTWKLKNGNRKYISAELAYHNYYLVEKSISLYANVGIEKKIYKQAYFGFGFGLGLAKAKRADLVYELQNGEWKPTTYPGKWLFNRQLLKLNAEVGYRFNKIPLDAYLGTNIEYLNKYYGTDLPFNLNYSPIKIGVRWHLK